MIQSLKFEELKVGMIVEDLWCERGKIIECDDPHNVFVQYDNGGSGLYCLDNDCDDRDPTGLYKIN